MKLTRRNFIATGSLMAAGAVLAVPADAIATPAKNTSKKAGKNPSGHHTIYRLSVRGRRRSSRAAKSFCANLRFQTKNAAAKYPRPHPGINARIVGVVVSGNEFHRLFISRHSQVADLRELRSITVVGVRPG